MKVCACVQLYVSVLLSITVDHRILTTVPVLYS